MAYKCNWQASGNLGPYCYDCHYCGRQVSSEKGWYGKTVSPSNHGNIYICPNCNQPTYFSPEGKQIPAPPMGRPVNGISDKAVEGLFNEARNCATVGAYTASVLLARKLLMNIAVQHEAKEGLPFIEYIDYLANKGFVPPNGILWVDQIRIKGNEATHEIPQISSDDAKQILTFVEMLLRFIYEFPSMVKQGSNP